MTTPSFDHSGEAEQARIADLLRLAPTGRASLLDIGARDGHLSRRLAAQFACVTAIDLERPTWSYPGIVTAAGDVTRLTYPDRAFDVVFCSEVLEHVPALEQACSEIARVARHEILIGVPYRQDTRLGRVTCGHCGRTSPAWGHVNEFHEGTLSRLLWPAWTVKERSFVGPPRHRTTALAAFLMNLGGNPWGSYDQAEPCPSCHRSLTPPARRSLPARLCSALADRLNKEQAMVQKPRPAWMHTLFTRR